MGAEQSTSSSRTSHAGEADGATSSAPTTSTSSSSTSSATSTRSHNDSAAAGDFTGKGENSAYGWLIGKHVFDEFEGDKIPTDKTDENRKWVDIQRFIRDKRAPTRLIRKDTIVTMEHKPNRLNIWIGDDEKVTKVKMG